MTEIQPSKDELRSTKTVSPAVKTKESMKTYSEKECNICNKSFTVFDRRHHCRMCNRAVCNNCSPNRLFLPGHASTAQRVCVDCNSGRNSQVMLRMKYILNY